MNKYLAITIESYAEACRATSFLELWRTLSNDQLFDLCEILRRTAGRDLSAPFAEATAEDWGAMTGLISNLGTAVKRLNALLRGVDCSIDTKIEAVLRTAEYQAEAAGESKEYVAVVEYLNDMLKTSAFGATLFRLEESHLIRFRTATAPSALDESTYDIFISYKTWRYSENAARLAERLTALGYQVWFDKNILDKMQDRPEVFERDNLISILTNAVQRSACTIIFEATMHAAAIPPGRTEEDAIADGTMMRQGCNVVAWDWQGLEIAATSRGITIHPSEVIAFQAKDGKTLWIRSFSYDNYEQLLSSIKAALELFGGRAGLEKGKRN